MQSDGRPSLAEPRLSLHRIIHQFPSPPRRPDRQLTFRSPWSSPGPLTAPPGRRQGSTIGFYSRTGFRRMLDQRPPPRNELSCGEMLNVPPVNWCGKLDVDNLVRFYPEERSAEQTTRRSRYLERSTTSRRSAARRHGCSCQTPENVHPQAAHVTPPRSPSATSSSYDNIVANVYLAASTWGRRQPQSRRSRDLRAGWQVSFFLLSLTSLRYLLLCGFLAFPFRFS
ncbi:hypothetical protein EI94DRAFT_1277406 [Lactarius quietus]|nr:hypothetical protein EI94DRAFT_1277406 [Lactarius quietus]